MGWDPYDGLNSKVFQELPIKESPTARMFWIQAFKRSPINLRTLFLVPKEYNPKGISLLLTAYCNEYKAENLLTGGDDEIKNTSLTRINFLADLLLSLKTDGCFCYCWGYNFDWQIRNKYFFPKYTPTVVATSFASSALALAYEITGNNVYRDAVISSADFILNDLKRTTFKEGLVFSYSPLPGNDLVINASLLGAKTLALAYSFSGKKELIETAKESVRAAAEFQNADGSWPYGLTDYQRWIDSFHTGYNLEAISFYQKLSGDNSFSETLHRGLEYYLANFFLSDGTPKYYHNKIYPVDIHCPAQLPVTLFHLNKLIEHKELVTKVLEWTVRNMQTKAGYFIYQKKRLFSSKIPYMRWSQAFMLYALSYYLLSQASDA